MHTINPIPQKIFPAAGITQSLSARAFNPKQEVFFPDVIFKNENTKEKERFQKYLAHVITQTTVKQLYNKFITIN